jgi:chromosomal replication initiator protein
VITRGADFARELATAIDDQTLVEFRRKYRSAGLFVLDDLLQLSGRTAALQELQHVLDEFEAREVPVLITSRRPPDEIVGLPPALRSRLNGGLVLTVCSPGIAAREKILHRTAAQLGIVLSPAAAHLLAEKISRTAGELRGVLSELLVELNSTSDGQKSQPIEAEDVRRFLSKHSATHRPKLNQISALVAKYYGLTPSTLATPSRRRQVVLARAVAIYLGRTLCGSSLKSLGKHFGGRDHSTALHNFRQIETRLAHDSQLSGAVEHLSSLLSAA